MASARSIEMVRAGTAIYNARLRQMLEASHVDEFVAIDPESGDYYLGTTLSDAIQSARAAYPERLPCVLRVGHASAIHY